MTYRCDNDCPFRWVVAHRPRLDVLRPKLLHAHHADIASTGQVAHADGLITNVEQCVAGKRKRWTFAFELEDDEAVVVAWMKSAVLR
jgi:hypothetical protein